MLNLFFFFLICQEDLTVTVSKGNFLGKKKKGLNVVLLSDPNRLKFK